IHAPTARGSASDCARRDLGSGDTAHGVEARSNADKGRCISAFPGSTTEPCNTVSVRRERRVSQADTAAHPSTRTACPALSSNARSQRGSPTTWRKARTSVAPSWTLTSTTWWPGVTLPPPTTHPFLLDLRRLHS